jgi:tetratricopeptide (TPR) repeat protein
VDGQDPEAALQSMQAPIARALALAPESGEVHARAAQYYGASGDLRQESKHWERALALAPNNMLVVSFSAGAAADRGEFAQALRHQRRAVELDPVGFVSRYNLAVRLLITGRYEQAWQELGRARQLNPANSGLEELTAELLVLRGRHEEALEAALALPDGPRRECFVVLAYDGLGLRPKADAALAALRARSDAESVLRIAEIHAWRGETDTAFEWLERARAAMIAAALTPGERLFPAHLLDSGFLRPLHGDPRLARYSRQPGRDTWN